MVTETFTPLDALAWLGISEEAYRESGRILAGRHGNPIASALLAAREAQGTDMTPEMVLARYDIDPADPLVAVRAYDRRRAKLHG